MLLFVQKNTIIFCGWNTQKHVALTEALDQVSNIALQWICNYLFLGRLYVEESGREGQPKY